MKILDLKVAAAVTILTLVSAFTAPFGSAQAQSIPISDQPLFTTSGVPPLMMMVMSRDEQLFIKAYDDYSDLDGDGILDTTYQDRFDYSGYFDPALCYTYSNGQFSASAKATGALAEGQKNSHQCNGTSYSGNFMNWVAMSRLDVLSFVLYGGKRTTPEPTDGAVLERAPIAPDLHAWAKVYSGNDTNKYTPYSGKVSFCNATMTSGGAPTIRVAQGEYPEWAATASQMCNWREEAYPSGNGSCSNAGGDNSCYDDAPKSAALATANGLTARVKVCANSAVRESFCARYTDSSNGTSVAYRPTGLLQTYGEKGQMRFGLLTGSFSKPRSGGVLRRNIGLFAGNAGAKDTEGCAADDEVNLNNGKFCTHGTSGNKGIVSTISALDISGYYNYTTIGSGGGANDKTKWRDCYNYGILNRQGFDGDRYLNDPGAGNNKFNCAAWGNPLSEMYAEALRYISTSNPSSTSPTSVFTGGTDLAGLPTGVAWKDPYRSMSSGGNAYCANCSILVLSTGLNSFDSDEIPTVAALSRQAAASTKAVGALEDVNGTYSVGRVASGTPGDLAVGTSTPTHTDLCTAKGVADLSVVRGICPDIPAMEGSYLMSGLAFDAWTKDLRPDLHDSPPDGNPKKPGDFKNVVKTFSVALARNLPSFHIPVGNRSISLAPLCQANNSGSGDALGGGNDKNWRSCYMGSVTIGQKAASSSLSPSYVYGRNLDTSSSPKYGSFTFVWEDSLWGNDHENDVVTTVTYCVGAACQTNQQSGRKDLAGNAYNGYDICWRAYGTKGTTLTTAGGFVLPGQASATKDPYGISSPCPSDGKPTVGADEVLIRIENISAYAGNAMLTGYSVTGSSDDGVKRLTLRPGNENDTLLNKSINPKATWYAPIVRKYKASTAAAKELENPLFYAAKYGSFNDANSNGVPDAGEWDSEKAGVPDNFFAVTDPSKLKEELQKIFEAVIAGASPSGSVAASASRFTVGQTLAYQSSYDSNNWVGDLKAFSLNSNGSLGNLLWSAAGKLPSGARDTIWVGVPDGSQMRAEKFTRANLTTDMSAALTGGGGWLNDQGSVDNLIAYLSGSQEKEEPSGIYRKRDAAKRLGDIVNSSPQVAYKIGFGYDLLQPSPGCDAGCIGAYKDYVDAKPTTIFVGANDGMLHAFNGTANGGEELFAYIPNAVVPNLGKLAKPKYVHEYFVDGTPSIGDAYINGWKTVLVGSAGAGARSVFALDVTSPTSFNSNSLLFEFNDQTDPDMGQFTGIPSPPTLTADTKWVTAFGNGYNGASNKAKLFVINLADGSQITTDPITDAANAAPNGLSTATIIDAKGTCSATGEDVCSDGIGDTIYAGDYRGNVWKFVLSGNRWRLSPSTPIFKAVDDAGHRQPITSGMYAIKNPLGGAIIYFGTGKYLTTSDNDPVHLEADGKPLINSLYAIWDDGSGTIVTRDDLQEQRITAYNDTTGAWTMTQIAFGYRSENYPAPLGKMGWYLDLSVAGADPDPLSGERVVASPVGLLSRLFVNVFRPIGDICLPAGVNSLLELDLLNGSAAFPSDARGFGGGGNEGGTGLGGQNIGQGPPLNSPNPVVTIPGQTGIPAIGCPDNDPNCVPTPPSWCTPDVPGYPKCADPAWCQPSTPGYPNCPAPADCHPASGGLPASPGYPYCKQDSQCSLIPNAGTPIGNQNFQCRASWRQLR